MIKMRIFVLLCLFWVNHGCVTQPTYRKENGNDLEILAHRGVHQDFSKKDLENKTCTAKRMLKPVHLYIENTIESIEKAFEMGATVVEMDVYNTADGNVVVFHDAMLECRTNGTGRPSDHDLAYLKSLDIGFGYTFDNGRSYPLRGKGVGRMPTLREVLEHFPEKKFVLDYKQGRSRTTAILVADIIAKLNPKQQKNLFCEGQDKAFKEIVRKKVPDFYCLFPGSKQIKRWIISYFLTFGIMDSVDDLDNRVVVIPIDYANYLWGWPDRLLRKIHDAGGKVFVYVNNEDSAIKLNRFDIDGIITDHIDKIGVVLRESNSMPEKIF